MNTVPTTTPPTRPDHQDRPLTTEQAVQLVELLSAAVDARGAASRAVWDQRPAAEVRETATAYQAAYDAALAGIYALAGAS